MSFLELKDISKRYPATDKPAVENFNLSIDKGEFISLLGPSGCGKTTTLRMLAGLIEPTGGSIVLDDTELTRLPVHRRDMGMVFQSYALFPHLDVKQNVAFGLDMRKVSKAETASRVREALELVHMGHLADRRIKALSGGQQQRVALARALVIRPKVLLLDEPLSNLDAKLRDVMRDEIRSIQQQVGITTVFVTHDQDEALATSDRIVVMSDGHVEQVGSPRDIYETPVNRFVATFIGQANLVKATLSGNGEDAVGTIDGLGPMPMRRDPAHRASVATVMIRPHRINVEPANSGTPHGTVTSVVYVGDQVSYSIQAGGQPWSVQAVSAGARPLDVGTPVRMQWKRDDAVALPES